MLKASITHPIPTFWICRRECFAFSPHPDMFCFPYGAKRSAAHLTQTPFVGLAGLLFPHCFFFAPRRKAFENDRLSIGTGGLGRAILRASFPVSWLVTLITRRSWPVPLF